MHSLFTPLPVLLHRCISAECPGSSPCVLVMEATNKSYRTGVPVMPSPPESEGIHNLRVDRNNVAITRSQRQTWFVFLQGSEISTMNITSGTHD